MAGTLAGGIASLADRADLIASFPRLDAAELSAKLASSQPPVVLDVRGAGEREASRIEGSMHVPLPELEERLAEIPRDRDIVVHCAGGFRSAIAVGILQAHGFTRLSDLRGGMSAWRGK